MGKIRIGILGASRIVPGALVAPAHPEFTLQVLAARDPARAKGFAQANGIAHVAPDYDALLARDDVDLVYVALCNALHKPWTIAALERGKPVLCEKPFALDAAQARAMVAASRTAGRALIEGYHHRFHQVMTRAVEIVRAGELGPILHSEAVFEITTPYTPTQPRWQAMLGGGALMDLGCYPLYALRLLIGEEPQVVAAHCELAHGVDAATRADLHFPGGATGRIACRLGSDRAIQSLHLRGEKGSLAIDGFVTPQAGCRFTVTTNGVTREEPVDGPSTFYMQLSHVADVLLRGAVPLTGGADAIAQMTAIEAIYAKAGFIPFGRAQ
jgi:predicted dehydrogenase